MIMDRISSGIENSIQKGTGFLERRQLKTGEFACYMSDNELMESTGIPGKGWCQKESMVFPSILIGSSLLTMTGNMQAEGILVKVTGFLMAQKKQGSVWNHYTSTHGFYPFCPFDSDDTACASSFLKSRKVEFPDNSKLLLTNTSSKKLFYTWITLRLRLNRNRSYWMISLRELIVPVKTFFFWKKMECSRTDVDAVVNANVLYYLGPSSSTKPVIKYLVDIILLNKETDCDKWYRNPFTVYYFLSRNYFRGITELEPVRKIIYNRMLAQLKQDGCIGNTVLDTALSICTILNLRLPVTELSASIQYLVNEQADDGSWKRIVFYYGGPSKQTSFGCEELTTAFCLEALSRFQQTNETPVNLPELTILNQPV